MGPNTFFYTGTERMALSNLAPFRSFPCSLEGVETRSYSSHTKTDHRLPVHDLDIPDLHYPAHVAGCDPHDLKRSWGCFPGGICTVQILHSASKRHFGI